MHRVLQIDEIMAHVLADLEHSCDLAAMARVCWGFNAVASDILWREIPSIKQLIMLMPSDLVKLSTRHRAPRLVFTRDPVPDDWKRFQHYAARVRCFSTKGFSPFPELDKSISVAFGLPHQPSPDLFPGLQSLEVSSDMRQKEFQFLHLMIGPQLRSFKLNPLNVVSDDSVQGGSLSPLLERLESCGSLKHLDLEFSVSHTEYHRRHLPMVCDIVARTPSLRTFRLNDVPIPLKAMTSIASYVSLREIDISIEPSVLQGFLSQSSPQSRSLPRLEHVSVTANDLNMVSSLIKCFNSRQLKTVRSALDHTPTFDNFETHFSTLESLGSHVTLEELGFRMMPPMYWRRPSTSNDTIDSHTLRPLLAFRNLRNVTISLQRNLDIDDQFIGDIASSWPLLCSLVLDGPWKKPHRITLEGLRPLAEKCQSLTRLSLVIDGTVCPHWKTTLSSKIISTSTLELFELGESEIGNYSAKNIAAYLSTIFPRVTITSGERWGPKTKWTKKWNRVMELFPTFSKA